MMSPEPTQEPVKENLNAPDISIGARALTDSDSEDEEDMAMAGYMPLSQIPIDSEPMLEDDEDDEWALPSRDLSEMLTESSMRDQQMTQNVPSETIQVWSTQNHRPDIDLDAEKINQVKSLMTVIQLPDVAIPEWANTVSEDQWKQRLMDRIKEIQQRDK
ncbi:male-enhanced antigen 1 [Orussus abietinus]|uniref:male-enhanced antigen 1 n=1 Tax=Orussus abietinus TaxID=222816 RepID=UPI000626E03A|nr:male-enhanced antigen 1 [Orussus abietinus]